MDAYRVHAWGTNPVLEEVPDPVPGPGEVLIEVEACGVGLTVLNCINGDLADDPDLLPVVPGHELAGRVVEAGPGREPAELVGRRVVAYFYLVCGTCPACTAGLDPRCSRLAGWVGVHRGGGYGPRAVLPWRNAVPVPEDLDPVSATVVPDAVATPLHIAGRADIRPGDRVAVVGAGGGVGVHMIQIAGLHGADVVGLDVAEDKLATIESLGARAVASPDFTSLDPGLFDGRPPTVVVDLIGTPASTGWALDGLGMGGRLVALTTFRDRPVPIESRDLVFRELSVVGSRYATRSQVTRAAELVASGAVQPVIGSVTGPAGVLGLHDRLRTGDLVGRGALRWGSDHEEGA